VCEKSHAEMGTHEVNRALARWHDAGTPGCSVVLIALVGNDKGDLAGFTASENSKAVPKSMA